MKTKKQILREALRDKLEEIYCNDSIDEKLTVKEAYYVANQTENLIDVIEKHLGTI